MPGGSERAGIVIVGGGLAGVRAAERLRERGFAGWVTLIGDEPGAPYNRPPLSKQLLTGRLHPSDLGLQTFTPLGVELRTGQPAVALDPRRRTVELSSGEQLGYDGLIIATGVTARRPPAAPRHDERVVALRTLDHARALRHQLTGARRVAIVGGGFIGCEVAASLRRRSLPVTLIDRNPVLLEAVLGHQVGGVLTELHRRAGVDVLTGTQVVGWRTNRSGVHLDLCDGTAVSADVVVTATGSTPAVSWLGGSGLDTTDGVLCDETCHVVGCDDVVAAGDVARWPNLRFDRTPHRVEHWINAVEMARAAADSLLDGPERARPFTPVPRFWSEQHDTRIQSVGMPRLGNRVAVIEGDVGRGSFVAAYLRGDRPTGVVGFNATRSVLDCADLIEARNRAPISRRGLRAGRPAGGTVPARTAARRRLPATALNRSRLVPPPGARAGDRPLQAVGAPPASAHTHRSAVKDDPR